MLKVIKVRLDPNLEQQHQLACTFGASRWWWNYALNKSIETYKKICLFFLIQVKKYLILLIYLEPRSLFIHKNYH